MFSSSLDQSKLLISATMTVPNNGLLIIFELTVPYVNNLFSFVVLDFDRKRIA
jgi:hypothetical protein